MARFLLRGGGTALLICALLAAALTTAQPAPAGAIGGAISPSLHVRVLADGLTLPWDLAHTPDGVLVFTERPGRLNARMADGKIRRIDADFADLFVNGETGLLGMVLHPDFSENRRFYTCQGHTGAEIQVIGWTMGADYRTASRIADPLVGGIDLSTGRHGGCRLRFDLEGDLFIATGDAAGSSNPQSLTSLAGKVLRVDPDTGDGVAGNPFANSANADTRRIYTYGHRNLQGLTRRPGTNEMWTVEHGPNVDDEINRLVAGGNYGWDPGPGYAENVPMTDLAKFPDAIEAQWSTGSPTLAMAGGWWVTGSHWGPLNGTLAVASLKNSTLRFFDFDGQGSFIASEIGDELSGTYGRLRTPMAGPRRSLYVTTSNGSNDKILLITPTGSPQGSLDVVRVRNGAARIKGWAIDPNRVRPTTIQVRIDDEIVTSRTARTRRPDVGAAFPDYGSRHGFSLRVQIPDGEHELCVDAIDVGRKKQDPVELGCRTVTG
jgi:glucose/arabinose dehydrogenase